MKMIEASSPKTAEIALRKLEKALLQFEYKYNKKSWTTPTEIGWTSLNKKAQF